MKSKNLVFTLAIAGVLSFSSLSGCATQNGGSASASASAAASSETSSASSASSASSSETASAEAETVSDGSLVIPLNRKNHNDSLAGILFLNTLSIGYSAI